MNSHLNEIQHDLEKKHKERRHAFCSYYLKYSHPSHKTHRPQVIGKHLITNIEPSNPVDKYAVCVNKGHLIVWHLSLGKKRKVFDDNALSFASWWICNVRSCYGWEVVYLGGGDGMQVSCALNIGKKAMVEILKQEICKHKLKVQTCNLKKH